MTVAIFPLPEVVFFPETRLHLHVFEPRYVDLVTEALATDRMLGVVQLRPGWDKDYYGRPAIYKVLGVGEIVESQRLNDGRFDIEVHGRFRAHVLSETVKGEYRTAEVEIMKDVLQPEDREEVLWVHERLLELYKKLAAAMPETMSLIDNPSPGALIDAMADKLVENPYDKQSILSETNLARRQRLLRVQLRTMVKGTQQE
ncbi:MAG: LON peptidase substrate-binding domain-containing protein [Candidatus Sumerlaeaceae bacterium]